ncbi:hypothetical protein JB92DRAFT_1832325 [Gautieria morchelliformis]|nr:hypothetical protein JB92DRAFT_1832325 [Gautieria morchelliformis]
MPLKLAIVGAGPSAFYVAGRLLQLVGKAAGPALAGPAAAPLSPDDVRIHIYERLCAPYGLVRYGVAPDHPEVKNCTHKFDITASDPRVRFFGHVRVGGSTVVTPSASARACQRLDTSTSSSKTSAAPSAALPLPLPALFPHYTHLVFATGAPTPRTHPLLPSAPGVCVPALDIVRWYTGHPEAWGGRCGHALLMSAAAPPARTAASAASSDVSLRVLTAVPDTVRPIPPNTRHVSLIGHGNVSLDVARLLLTPPSRLASLSLPPPVLDTLTALWETIPPANLGEDARARVELALEETRLDGETGRAVGTGRYERVATDLVVTSLGYEGDAAMFEDAAVPWYDMSLGRMRTQNAGGRVMTPDGAVVPRVYASGWAGRGAEGVLAGTLVDANDVAAAIVEDSAEGGNEGGLLARGEEVQLEDVGREGEA